MCRTAITTLGVVVIALAASAGAAADVIASDANGMPGWQGVVRFQSQPQPLLTVDVEFCVYEPDQFELSFGFDPHDGHYVYAFYLDNNLADHPYNPETSRDYITGFSVGLTQADGLVGVIGSVANGEWDYFNASFAPSTASWTWANIPVLGHYLITYGNTSDVLYFTSPLAPDWDNATVTGANADTELLPSPIVPEPASAVLLGIALVAARALRRRRA